MRVEQPVADDRVEALAVVVDHPPAVAEVVLPAFEQRLVDVALVELGVADQRDHAALRAGRVVPAVGVHIVLHQAGEQRLRRRRGRPSRSRNRRRRCPWCARDRTARRRSRGSSRSFSRRLVAEQVLDGVEHRARVRLHRDAVLRPQHVEIERRHQRGERGGRGLMAADLQPVDALAQMVGVVDRPAGEPQHLLFELAQETKLVRGRVRRCSSVIEHGLSGVLGTAEVLSPCRSKSERAARICCAPGPRLRRQQHLAAGGRQVRHRQRRSRLRRRSATASGAAPHR